PAQHALTLAGLKDGDPFVQRAAAEALGRHPSAANVPPLLELRHRVPAGDTHLLHVVRMALRNQLTSADVWERLALAQASKRDKAALADVSLGTSSPKAAAFLLAYLQERPALDDLGLRFVHHIVRHGDGAADQDVLARTFRKGLPAAQVP